ncbi:hypothetical protein LXL04_002630 [Taraxacum kok-saghyz]
MCTSRPSPLLGFVPISHPQSEFTIQSHFPLSSRNECLFAIIATFPHCYCFSLNDIHAYSLSKRLWLAPRRYLTKPHRSLNVLSHMSFRSKDGIFGLAQMLRFQDRLHAHAYFRKAAAGAIRCYIKLYDSPPTSTAEDDELAKMPASQKKKLRQKQRKAEARAKKEAEVKNEEANAGGASKYGKRNVKAVDPDPHGEKLLQMESQIHYLEQVAYSSVLRAFKAQSDALSWEKEGLITELRKELRVSDDEHRELLSDDIIIRIRERICPSLYLPNPFLPWEVESQTTSADNDMMIEEEQSILESQTTSAVQELNLAITFQGKGAVQKKVNALRELRRLLSKSGAIPLLAQCLSFGSQDEQLLEAAWCLTNIAAGKPEETRALLPYPYLLPILEGPDPKAATELIKVDGVVEAILRHLRKSVLVKTDVLQLLVERLMLIPQLEAIVGRHSRPLTFWIGSQQKKQWYKFCETIQCLEDGVEKMKIQWWWRWIEVHKEVAVGMSKAPVGPRSLIGMWCVFKPKFMTLVFWLHTQHDNGCYYAPEARLEDGDDDDDDGDYDYAPAA